MLNELKLLKGRADAHVEDVMASLDWFCGDDKAVKELVTLVVTSVIDEDHPTVSLGYQVGRFIEQITGEDVFSVHTCLETLNYFVSNYIYDDSAFDFSQDHKGVFTFCSATGEGRELTNPVILLEAAKAHVDYCCERSRLFNKIDGFAPGYMAQLSAMKVDDSKVMAILNNERTSK